VYKYSLLFNTVRTTTLILGLTRYGGPDRPPSPGGAWKFEIPRTADLLFPSTARSPRPPSRACPLRQHVARGPDLRARNGYSEKLFQIEG